MTEQPTPYSLEYSRYSDERGKVPFHIGPLKDALEHNLIDFYHNQRGENKWQIVYIGTPEDCYRVMEGLTRKSRPGIVRISNAVDTRKIATIQRGSRRARKLFTIRRGQ
jgi:hypothetical protein